MAQPPQVKVLVDQEEHARIRLAAALRGVPMTQFARQVVLDEANRITRQMNVANAPDPVGKGRIPAGRPGGS